jgi:hypothetical protein
MAKTALVDDEVELGRRATEALDGANVDVRASFWYHDPDAEEWHLVIVTPLAESDGPRASYARILRALRDCDVDLPGRRIVAKGPGAPLVRSLRRIVRTGRGITGIRLSDNVVDGVVIEDAYVYRLL